MLTTVIICVLLLWPIGLFFLFLCDVIDKLLYILEYVKMDLNGLIFNMLRSGYMWEEWLAEIRRSGISLLDISCTQFSHDILIDISEQVCTNLGVREMIKTNIEFWNSRKLLWPVGVACAPFALYLIVVLMGRALNLAFLFASLRETYKQSIAGALFSEPETHLRNSRFD